MKKLLFIILLLFIIAGLRAQNNRIEMLQNVEKAQTGNQDQQVTATLSSATRLFGDKDDLTSVIQIIPSGSVVKVLGGDSTYLKVVFEENEGFIFRKHAVIDSRPEDVVKTPTQVTPKAEEQPAEQPRMSRFTYLENKYGTNTAALLAAGKIWKGMSTDMVRDSWGTALKINREIGNYVKEEWIYKNSWLYFEDNRLIDWGPVKK